MERGDRALWIALGGTAAAVALLAVMFQLAVPEAVSAPTPRVGEASASERPRSRPTRYSAGAQRRRARVFAAERGAVGFRRLGEPEPGEWLFHFREPGQTAEEYAARVVNRKNAERRLLHLQPYSDLAPHQLAILEPMRAHTAIFFDSETVLLPAHAPEPRWLDARRRQYNADRIVASLAERVPASSLGLFGLMGSDLYGLGLNFVFGEALLSERAGIYSVHRFGREPRPLLRRALKLASHEIGHLFGIQHCVFYECVMNGTNSLAETDRRPLHLCPVCRAKLQGNLRFDPVKRYRALAAFYRKHSLVEEAAFAEARAAELAR
jgi:archaemetzincin